MNTIVFFFFGSWRAVPQWAVIAQERQFFPAREVLSLYSLSRIQTIVVEPNQEKKRKKKWTISVNRDFFFFKLSPLSTRRRLKKLVCVAGNIPAVNLVTEVVIPVAAVVVVAVERHQVLCPLDTLLLGRSAANKHQLSDTQCCGDLRESSTWRSVEGRSTEWSVGVRTEMDMQTEQRVCVVRMLYNRSVIM